ncbi:hypothetical protein FQN55_001114 [Onygenales sp. PD_40]|nr:hypothetical protein FQN55_001114 [Onygenales sp. PD_40]
MDHPHPPPQTIPSSTLTEAETEVEDAPTPPYGHKGSPIEHWVDTSSWPFAHPADSAILIRPFQNESASTVPNCFSSIQSLSGVSEDGDDGLCGQGPLDYRGVYVYRNEPPEQLMRTAREVVNGEGYSATSFTADGVNDDTIAEELSQLPRCLWNASEDEIVEKLAARLAPTIPPDHLLSTSLNKPWTHSLPLPLLPEFQLPESPIPPPLPCPTPSLAYGFSQSAFTKSQHAILGSLTTPTPYPNHASPKSPTCPDAHLLFPFLTIHVAAPPHSHHPPTDAASTTAALALHGLTELYRRSLGADAIDYASPRFFSLTVDGQTARVNVHWLALAEATRTRPANMNANGNGKGRPFRFHTELVGVYLLCEKESVKALRRAVRGVLGYAVTVLLGRLRVLLDVCRRVPVLAGSAAGTGDGRRGSVVSTARTEIHVGSSAGAGGGIGCTGECLEGQGEGQGYVDPDELERDREREREQQQEIKEWEEQVPDVLL